jgi:hypothetical protein
MSFGMSQSDRNWTKCPEFTTNTVLSFLEIYFRIALSCSIHRTSEIDAPSCFLNRIYGTSRKSVSSTISPELMSIASESIEQV